MLLCLWFMLETLLVSVLMYSSETMIWKEIENSAVHWNNLNGLQGIRRMDRVPNAQISYVE